MEASIHSVHAASRKVTHAIQNVTPIKAIVALSKHKDSVPKVPDPKIFADLSQLPGKTEPPSIAQCAVHLKFLECLFVLRQKVLKSEELDKVFDIEPNYKIVKRKGVDTKLKDETLWERRQVKWHKFVEFAVVRFVAWWEKLREIVEVKEGDRVVMGVNELPPLGKCDDYYEAI